MQTDKGGITVKGKRRQFLFVCGGVVGLLLSGCGQKAEKQSLMIGGNLYYATEETGPMGDAGAVGGHILSATKKTEIPSVNGQSNFGEVGNPYTRDDGDGMIQVLVGEEYRFFQRQPKGIYCAYIRGLGEDTVTVDVAEWINGADEERIQELGLTEADREGDHYIHNPYETEVTWELDSDLRIYTDSESGTPCFIEVDGNVVKEISEKPIT